MKPKTLVLLLLLILLSSKDFSQNRIAAVKGKKYWGFINDKGDTVIPFMYDEAHNFSCGIAMVRKKYTWMYINLKNKNITEGRHLRLISDFYSNRGVVYDSVIGKKVAITKTGEVIPTSQIITIYSNYSNGYARVRVNAENGGIRLDYGFIDTSGTLMSKKVYRHTFSFSQNKKHPLAFVRSDADTLLPNYIKKWIWVKPNGEEIRPPRGFEFREYNSPVDQLKNYRTSQDDSIYIMIRRVKAGENFKFYTYGFINDKSEIVILDKFMKAGNFNEGLAAASIDGVHWGFIDYYGNFVIENKYTYVSDFSNGIALVYDGRSRYIDKQGNFICNGPNEQPVKVYNSFVYPPPEKFPFKEGMAKRLKGVNYGFINTSCELKVPYKYLNVKDFNAGYAAVKTASGWGFVDKNGNEIITPKYEEALPMVNISDEAESEDIEGDETKIDD